MPSQSSQRSPEQIRASIESHRADLAGSLEKLRTEVTVAADWRQHLRDHQQQVLIGAAVVGFVLGGGMAGVTGIFRRRR